MLKDGAGVGARLRIHISAVAFALALLPGSPASADARTVEPIFGRWKADLKEAAARTNPLLPKSYSETYAELPSGEMQLDSITVNRDGSETHLILVFPERGGAVQEHSRIFPAGRTDIETRISPYEWRMTSLIDGAQQATMQKLISHDGKTMRQIVRYTDKVGKVQQYVRVMRRQ